MAVNEPSDRTLAGAIVGHGDEASFRTLYRRHTPSLYPFVLRVLGGAEEDAEDVIQDTWVRAVRGLATFRWESSFRTWLLGIGLNRAREILRKRKRHDRSAELPDMGANPW
jgi:RNA polymerase sigma-70 factor (ECF subfamily)